MKARPLAIHFEALLPRQREILSASATPAQAWNAYLAGGLAVALQLGHRVSADFDWFTANTNPPDKLLGDIKATGLMESQVSGQGRRLRPPRACLLHRCGEGTDARDAAQDELGEGQDRPRKAGRSSPAIIALAVVSTKVPEATS